MEGETLLARANKETRIGGDEGLRTHDLCSAAFVLYEFEEINLCC